MTKRKAAVAAAASGVVILTISFSVFLTNEMHSSDLKSTQAGLAASEALDEVYASAQQDTQAEKPSSEHTRIWVGDSRTVGMGRAVGEDTGDCFIGASGEGYDWLYSTGLSLLEDAIKECPEDSVVLNFGVNDYDNLENYLSLYQSLSEKYPDTTFYFLSVNPVDPERCQYITNEEIETFNRRLQQIWPDTFLDSYTYLLQIGAETIDGIHYSSDDYRRIYSFVKEEIQEIQARETGTDS